MSRDDIEEHIREKMDEPTDITAADLAPPVCVWCGEELAPDDEVVVWDIPEYKNESVIWRYRFCSEECKSDDQNAIVSGEEMHPHGRGERIDPEVADAE